MIRLEQRAKSPGPWYVFNDAIKYLLIHVYLKTRRASQVNYSHWPAKTSLSEVMYFGPLVDLLQYNYDDSNGKLNDTQLYWSLASQSNVLLIISLR